MKTDLIETVEAPEGAFLLGEEAAQRARRREYQRTYQREWRARNPEIVRSYRTEESRGQRRQHKRDVFAESEEVYRPWVLEHGGCVVCGETHRGCLQAHHVDPRLKDALISALRRSRNWERLRNELDKCIPLCSNHHDQLHYYLNNGLQDWSTDELVRYMKGETVSRWEP